MGQGRCAAGFHSHDSDAEIGRADSWAIRRGSGIQPASGEAKRAGRIGEHHTAGLLDSQAALSLVDLFSWVSRCCVIVRVVGGDGFVSCGRSRVRSFARSLVRWFADVSLYCWLAFGGNHNEARWCDERRLSISLSSVVLLFGSFSFGPGFVWFMHAASCW